MVKSKISILLTLPILILMSACNSSPEAILPTATPSTTRDITIEVINGNEEGLFEIGEIFTSRHHEGFVIWTHQANFWQPGDEFNAGSLDVKVLFDDSQSIEPFVFWPNSSVQNAEDGSGSFLATTMNISIHTSALTLGQHSMTVQVTNPRGQIFEHRWDFIIKQREFPRLPAPSSVVPTIEYLLENPQSTPNYFSQNSSMAFELDRFSPIGAEEGICFGVSEAGPLSPDPSEAENPFRHSKWVNISILVDGTILDNSQFGISSDSPSSGLVCFSTDSLAIGSHLAEIIFNVDGKVVSYSWAFEIE